MDQSPYENDIFYDAYGYIITMIYDRMRVWERRHQFANEVLKKYHCQKVTDLFS